MEETPSSRFRPRDFLTWPNAVSMLRVAAMPFFMWGLATDSMACVLGSFGIAFLSDSLDGYVARRTGVLSETGKIVDPVADKLAIGIAFVSLSHWRDLPWWFTGASIGRDLVIIVMSAAVYARRRTLPSSTPLGQSTVTVLAGVGFVFAIRWTRAYAPALAAGSAFLVVSLVHYARRAARIFSGAETGVRLGGGWNWLERLIGPAEKERDRGR